ncbi:MAG: hypothetical protein IKE63_02450 [Bacilli bacterium]|nr:hypothetical protein [Bacilli bacterium]
MNLKINKKTYEIKEFNDFKSRFKSLKFVLDPLDYIIKFPNKKIANTYFFVQKIDICFTDNKNRILKIMENVGTEKIIFEPTATNTYYLPLGCIKEYKVGDILK